MAFDWVVGNIAGWGIWDADVVINLEMFWFLSLGCCATAQKWERVRCAVSNKQERTNNEQDSELDWKPKVWQFPPNPDISLICIWCNVLFFWINNSLWILGKNLDLSYNYDHAFMIDHKCKVLFWSIFYSGLILRFYRQGSKSRNFPIGYIYFHCGTYISNRVHVFPIAYMYSQ